VVDQYFEANRRHWDEAADLHPDTGFYGFYLDRLRGGGTSLHRIEIDEVGDVRGKSLLHLQCHIGTESISWAKRGAYVTGVDFSAGALAQARRLASECGAEVRFIESYVYDLPAALDETFDVVFTSWGVLGWLNDIDRWGAVVGRHVKPGGIFYIAEFHPLAFIFDEKAPELRVAYPYFPGPEPLSDDSDGTYADPQAQLAHRTTYSWPYTLGGVVTALIDAGLQIEFLRERTHCVSQVLDLLVRDDIDSERWFRLPESVPQLPLSFSLRARKSA
jgi:SAM-dependent methyltransferase